LVETIRKLGLAKAPLAEKPGFTPPSRAAPMAVGYANSRHDRPYGLREPAVIKVNRTRAKTVEVDEDASKPTDRTDDKPAGLLIGRNGHPQRSPAQALDTTIPSYSQPASNWRSPTAERPASRAYFAVDYQRSRDSGLGYQVPKTSICLRVGGREMLLSRAPFIKDERV
jgi:hypothetical protein